MTQTSGDDFQGAATPKDYSHLSDTKLAIVMTLSRHGKLSDKNLIKKVQELENHCTITVLTEMFPNGVEKEAFTDRRNEFEDKYRSMIISYGSGDFNLPNNKSAGKKLDPEIPIP